MKYLIVFLCLVFIAHGALQVVSPSQLSKQFSRVNGIAYKSLSTPDNQNYERKVNGYLYYADYACDDIKADQLPESAIILAKSGLCSYAQKAKNVQNAGGIMLIIIGHATTIHSRSYHQYHMKNTNIEVVIISSGDGETLQQFVEDQTKVPLDQRELVRINFQLDLEDSGLTQETIKDNILSVEFFFSSNDKTYNSYPFLQELRSLLLQFGNLIKFQPHFVLYQSRTAQLDGFTKSNDACILNGRYCDPEAIEDEIKGYHIVIEDLRQLCLYQVNPEAWWNYVEYFVANCLNKSNSREEEECKDADVKAIGMTDDDARRADQCIENSFNPAISEKQYLSTGGDNDKLRGELELMTEYKVHEYPSLYVNRNHYPASLKNRREIFEFICNHFIEPTPACSTSQSYQYQEETNHSVIMLIIGTTVALMLLMICWVRARVKKSVYHDMQNEISSTIAQYKQFKDKSYGGNQIELE